MANESDYEKQYQEDLERAQALSLESLALERFRKEKIEKLMELNNPNSTNKSRSTSVTRTSSMNENDSNRNERLQVKSRPRPGCMSSNSLHSIIAPPPSSQRRNSSVSAPSEPTTPDLISFANPPPTSKIIDLQLLSTLQTITPNVSQPSIINQQRPFQFQSPLPVSVPNSFIPTSYAQQQYSWQRAYFANESVPRMPHVNAVPDVQSRNVNLTFHKMPITASVPNTSTPAYSSSPQSSISSISASLHQMPPALPPKNTQLKPPPLVLPSSSSRVQKNTAKPSTNLIDLTPAGIDDQNSVRVSILEAFDPLLSSSDDASSRTMSPDSIVDESASVGESVYDEYDPFEYIYSGSGNNSSSDPIYATIKSDNTPTPPLPPKAKLSTLDRRRNHRELMGEKRNLLFENIRDIDVRKGTKDADVSAFYKMVLKERAKFKYNDPNTNMGLVVSPMMAYQYCNETSIKLCVYPHFEGANRKVPVTFTCDVRTSVEHVTMQIKCDLDAPTTDQYTLKVWGYNEYLAPTTLLCDYEYVHSCIKLEEDVLMVLIPDKLVDKSLARTLQDDNAEIKIQDVLPNEPLLPISYDNIKLLLETLEKEMGKLEKAAADFEKNDNSTSLPPLQPSAVIQSVKYVVNLMGNLETIDITEALDALKDTCNQFLPNSIGLTEAWSVKSISEIIKHNCEKIRNSIQGLVEMYCQAFRVNFEWNNRDDFCDSKTAITDIQDTVLMRISAIHRPSPEWKFDDFIVAAQIYHGTRPIGKRVISQPCVATDSLYPRILINTWLDMEDVPVSSLARESRLVLILYGRTLQAPDGGDKDGVPQFKQEEIGWTAIQFFNYEGMMASGNILLSIWPKESNYIYGPAPSPGTHPDPNHPVFSVIIAGLPNVYFPPVSQQLLDDIPRGDFKSLDQQTQDLLIDTIETDMLNKIPINDREILWEKRHYLYNIPAALPKVLVHTHSWEWACLADLHGMLRHWKPLKPVQAVQLLLPMFPDMEVRNLAVKWINGLTNDELVDFLPQLVVALRHETYEVSDLVLFLLRRALQSLRVAHHLFWLLSHNLPGVTPQDCKYDLTNGDASVIAEVRHHRRFLLLLRALLAVCGRALCNCFMTQQLLNKSLKDVAESVKTTKESQRMKTLHYGLETLHQSLVDNPTSLPLSPTLQVCGVNARTSSYFPTNTLPLKINFLAKDGSTIPAIYKVGDDLQQDMLVLQMVRLMDKLWLKEGLDLKMVAFGCVPTGNKRGIIELVKDAETLRKIQVEHGLTGPFKDKPIAEWLEKHNPSELEYGRAVENFTASCAGYCVVTYILGICDRHNDNIMLKKSGHLFHIDFGKFLGDAQMFGNFKRDRAPFVFTSDMAYVINGGDRPSERFHKFVDLCCQAFNIVRRNGNLFLYLFTLMASSGIRGVTTEAVNSLNQALLLELSNPEAAAHFARLIESSLKSIFTQFNFFIHTLAQFKLSGDHGDGELLSFVPKRYTMQIDGRLAHVQVARYQKRYDPDKYYVYVLRVWRQGVSEPMELLRTYKEFCELHQKLCINFPLAKLFSLSTGMHMGRSNIKQVALKRYREISNFIASLFRTAEEICHSDLVYTFFHPLLRDQTPDQLSKKVKDRKVEEKNKIGRIQGQLKLSLHFHRSVFRVMVHHARDLPKVGNTQEPSTYVKVYLEPDPSKTTKRKTQVVKRNCYPTFMETLEYRMPLDKIMDRCLKATVWNYDALQENEFLGGVELVLRDLDLTTECTEWYPLGNLVR